MQDRPVKQRFLQVEPMPLNRIRRALLNEARELVRDVPKTHDIGFIVILPEATARQIEDSQAFFHSIFGQFARIKYADVDVVPHLLDAAELQEHIARYAGGRDSTFDYS